MTAVAMHRDLAPDLDAFAAMVADVAARQGRLDRLVNNAMANHYAVFIGTKAAQLYMPG